MFEHETRGERAGQADAERASEIIDESRPDVGKTGGP
jgi:hypothetical protein